MNTLNLNKIESNLNYLNEYNAGTGLKGYLGSVLNLNNSIHVKHNILDFINQEPDLIIYKSNCNFWLFGCPSNKKDVEYYPYKLSNTLEQLTYLKTLSLPTSSHLGYHIIYASSEGMDDMLEKNKTQLLYNQYKAVITHYISLNIKDATILKIPRVYGPNKKSGIFEKIENLKKCKKYDKIDELISKNFDNSLRTIEYITEEMFREWVNTYYKIPGIIEYNKQKKKIKFNKLVELILNNELNKL